MHEEHDSDEKKTSSHFMPGLSKSFRSSCIGREPLGTEGLSVRLLLTMYATTTAKAPRRRNRIKLSSIVFEKVGSVYEVSLDSAGLV